MSGAQETAVGPSRTRRDPERTRRRLLDAAAKEFSAKGLLGARVDKIAKRAGVNKQLVYHYFGSKDNLYLVLLEQEYLRYRQNDELLRLSELTPEDAMRRLAGAAFDGLINNRDFAALVADENMHKARHLRNSTKVPEVHQRMIEMVGSALARGEAAGTFRKGIDPTNFYISIAGMCSFYFTNRYTLATVFSRDLMSQESLASYRGHVVSMVMHSLRP
jgi:TetR/AcrR family transcriptional regulator